ncbi:MAG: hypothetical protein KME23_18245 [Goleter apudmare HA4340-LM2]|nr:hypothetical protein [Goleter apudmare HA4340-LM2]
MSQQEFVDRLPWKIFYFFDNFNCDRSSKSYNLSDGMAIALHLCLWSK